MPWLPNSANGNARAANATVRWVSAQNGLTGKVALVTGASRGIGEAAAIALDAEGVQVVLAARSMADLERVADQLVNEPIILPADLAESGAGTDLGQAVIDAVGGVDILVNNAGIPMRRTPEQITEEEVDLVFAINVRSLLMLTVELGPTMIARGGGSVINISSVAGLNGPIGRVAYSGTKGAVDGMTRALAADWGPQGIRVNSIAPGIIATAIWEESRRTVPGLTEALANEVPLKRWGYGEDIADVIVFLASDGSRYITGETITVDGGMTKLSTAKVTLPELADD